ncbi:hydroxymethylglutaryl-CoA synthase [Aerococcaceae bacterium WGS1372]
MVKVGIDQIAFHVPKHYVDMEELAHARDVDPNKYTIGIGQDQMAVPTIVEDIVSMGANAAFQIVKESDKDLIDQVIFATESGIDYSKSAATYIHSLLNIQSFAKSFEVKHACYGGTAALLSASDYVRLNPDRKVLVIMSDISRYGLNSGGEPTQGAGAIAMLVSATPRVLAIDSESVSMTDNQFDFWRPNYADVPFVEGKYSQDLYIQLFLDIIEHYCQNYPQRLEEMTAMVFHVPFTKMGRKCLNALLEKEDTKVDKSLIEKWLNSYDESVKLGRRVGNIYTGSLYLSLISLLSYASEVKAGNRIGLFSYGSGAVGELFTGTLQEGFENFVSKGISETHLDRRKKLDISLYEEIFSKEIPIEDGVVQISEELMATENGFYLTAIEEHRRIYKQQ